MISKLFFDKSSSATWLFSLTFYDGKYIDKKFAKTEMISLDTSLDISIKQQNGSTLLYTDLNYSSLGHLQQIKVSF